MILRAFETIDWANKRGYDTVALKHMMEEIFIILKGLLCNMDF